MHKLCILGILILKLMFLVNVKKCSFLYVHHGAGTCVKKFDTIFCPESNIMQFNCHELCNNIM